MARAKLRRSGVANMASVTCTCSQVDCSAAPGDELRCEAIASAHTTIATHGTVPMTFTPYFFSATSVSTARVTRAEQHFVTLETGMPRFVPAHGNAAVFASNPSQVASDANFKYDWVP